MTNPPLRSDEPMTREGCSVCGAADALPTNRGRRLCIRCSAPDNVIEVDRLTRALTEATREMDEWSRKYRLAVQAMAQFREQAHLLDDELSEANEKIARLTEEMERDRRIVAAHAKCDPKDCTVIVGLSIVHGHMPTEPHSALTTTEEKANG